MEWSPYVDEDVAGGVLEFEFRLELHVYAGVTTNSR
jgi:hypothetical protein